MHKENRFELNKKLHRRIAQISVGPSAIRNQGAKGIIAICRDYLEIPFDLKKNGKVLSQLEVPLDKDVALCLMKLFPDLPKWQSIKNLTPSESNQYQAKAKHYAEKLKIPRIHLDLEFWRKDR